MNSKVYTVKFNFLKIFFCGLAFLIFSKGGKPNSFDKIMLASTAVFFFIEILVKRDEIGFSEKSFLIKKDLNH